MLRYKQHRVKRRYKVITVYANATNCVPKKKMNNYTNFLTWFLVQESPHSYHKQRPIRTWSLCFKVKSGFAPSRNSSGL